MTRTKSTYLALLAVLLSPMAANAGLILAENGPHVVFNSFPFGPSFVGGRYQQVYSASLFGGATTINSIAFSPEVSGTWSADIEITLSTTTAAVGALSGSSLDNNVTGAETVVLSQLGYSQAVIGGSELFSLVFDISDYFYSGVDNLLLDISIANISYGGFGFSRSGPGTVFSRAYDGPVLGADGLGLRTLFETGGVAVPEPGTLALLGIGLLGMAATRRRRKI